MAIPEFDEDGVLPEGVHDCTLDEVRERFCRFAGSDRRATLCRALLRVTL